MLHQYSHSVAQHYAAFRPPLHEVILRRLIHRGEYFSLGLDVGCGTGYSAIALAVYSDWVIGLDPNQPMLDRAAIHQRISYVSGWGDDLGVTGQDRFDLVSFAGSLTYAKSDRLKSELRRTLAPEGVVLVYDYQVLLDELMADVGINGAASFSNYNFEENLNDWPEFQSEAAGIDSVQLHLSAQEISHILLANSHRYQAFQKRFNVTAPFDCLVDYIQRHNNDPRITAKLYFARYCRAL